MLRKLVAELVLIPLALIALATATAGHGANPVRPGDFVDRVDNPWFPLEPGTTYVYRGVKDGKAARDVFAVTGRTKPILGVRCAVVTDRLYLGGRLAERTTDWYAQDRKGSVWYFGEATAELDRRGKVISTEGTWQAGVHGAQPGIYMPARPTVGQSFRQEYYKGHAEDHFRIRDLNAHVHWIVGDVTKLGALARPPGYSLIYDLGCIQGLPDESAALAAEGITSLAAEDATLLFLAFARGRRMILPRGMDREHVEALFGPAWRLIGTHDVLQLSTHKVPPPIRKMRPTAYHLVKS
jgi:hypothetical protein